ncbi:unnamed protein product [Candidula unifasciata]|uniref:Uncharacterized protein n=1 Tax=Candidula unifasciata TaxID=100452 RepID=A0A8S3ZM96_9EUPU|nr:unnamed protein product [Candidula unifasciata]
MRSILCLCVVVLHVQMGLSQFVGSQQPSANSGFSMGTNPAGPQAGMSSFPPNSPASQPGFSTPTQRNDLSQTDGSSVGGSTNSFSSTGTSSPTQSNSPGTQSGVSSPTQPGLSQTRFSSTGQSNDPFSQTGVTSPVQTNPPNSQGSNLSGSSPTDFATQNSGPSNTFNSQSGVSSPAVSNDPFSQNNGFSSSASNSFPPAQANPPIPQTGPNVPNQSTQNGDVLSSQAGVPSTQSNGFPSSNTDSSGPASTFPSSVSNSSTSQPDSQSNRASAEPSSMMLVLATMLAGQYSNTEQHQEDNAKNITGPNKHALIEVTYIPVVVPALGKAVVFYFEQRINNSAQPARQAIYAFTQESACFIRMSTYDITNASRFSVTPEGLRALETLTLAELSNREECDAVFEQVGEEFFSSHLSTDRCTFEVSPRVMVRPSGSRNITCSGMTFTEVWRRVAGNEVVGGSPVPYIFKKTGNAFPVPVSVFSSNTCFKVPCMNSGVASPAGPTWSDIKPHMNYAGSSSTGQTTGAVGTGQTKSAVGTGQTTSAVGTGQTPSAL